jgi:type IV pilus assembly protein PilN
MRVRLNLATSALETHRKFLVASGLSAAVAGIVLVLLGWHVYTIRKIDEELRARTQKMQQETAVLVRQRNELERFFNLPENAKLHDRADFVNSIIDSASFNWTQMFMDLEHILPGGVHVVSIEPRQVGGHVEVKLAVGADSDDAKIKFLRALEESKVFSDVIVEKELTQTQTQGASLGDQKVVQLSVVYSRS